MCGRYAIAYSSEELPSHFKSQHLPVATRLAKGEHHDRSYNIAPTSDGAVYRAKDHELRYMKWGLVPHWTKSVKDFKTYKTFNARAENLQESRMWTQCCQSKRCVIPLNGYYEWKTKGKKKIPYYVVRNDGKLAFVAGLYDYLQSEDLWTYSIITAQAPKELTWLHNRMPVLLEPGSEAWETWMDPEKTEWTQEELDDLLAAHYDEKMLSVYQVSEEVNKVGSSSESMVKPIFKEDRGKFNLERFPEEEEQGGQAEGEPPAKRFKAEAKDHNLGQGLSGKIGGGYETKKDQKGSMVEGDQEEDLEVPETSLANVDTDEIEDAFVKDDEDLDLEEEYLKQSDDEEVEEEDLENVGGEEDDEYVEGGDENAEGSDYEVAKDGESGKGVAGESIGERVRNEDSERGQEEEVSNADITQEHHSRKNKTAGTSNRGDTGEDSSKWGHMTASEAGRKGGRKSSRSTGNDEEGSTTHRASGNRGKGDTGENSARWGSMTASEAGKKGGRKSSRSGDTGDAEQSESGGEDKESTRRGSGNRGKGDTGEHSARWGSMTASEAGKKGGRKSSRGGDTGDAEQSESEGEDKESTRRGSGNRGKGDTGEHSARWGSMTASEAGKKGGRKSSRSGDTGDAEQSESEGEDKESTRRGSGNRGKGDTGEHSARWGSMTASEAGKKGGRKSSRSGDTGDAEQSESEGEDKESTRRGSGNRGKGDTGEHSARWGSMTASEAGKKGGRKSSRSAGSDDDGDSSSKSGKMSQSEAGRKGGRRSSKSKDTGRDSSKWGDMNASEAGKKGGKAKKQHI